MEKSKKDRTIIKCKTCGFKYYDGDTHKCTEIRTLKVEEGVEEKSKERRVPIKTRKDSF